MINLQIFPIMTYATLKQQHEALRQKITSKHTEIVDRLFSHGPNSISSFSTLSMLLQC